MRNIPDANGVENKGQVVGHHAAPTPLGEECDTNRDQHSSPVRGSAHEVNIRIGVVVQSISLQGFVDFGNLEVDEWRVVVAVSVILGEYLSSLLLLSVCNKPSES